MATVKSEAAALPSGAAAKAEEACRKRKLNSLNGEVTDRRIMVKSEAPSSTSSSSTDASAPAHLPVDHPAATDSTSTASTAGSTESAAATTTTSTDKVVTIELNGGGFKVAAEFLMQKDSLFSIAFTFFQYLLCHVSYKGMDDTKDWKIGHKGKDKNTRWYVSDEISATRKIPFAMLPGGVDVGDEFSFTHNEFGFGHPTRVFFYIRSIRDATAEEARRTKPHRLPPPPPPPPPTLQTFLTEEQKQETLAFREEWTDLSAEGELELRSQKWCQPEFEAMTMLQYAGFKFTKAWNQVLQYSLPNRSRGASSVKWYQIKKDIKETDLMHNEHHWFFHGSSLTTEQCISRALSLLVKHRDEILKKGIEDLRRPHYGYYGSDDEFC